MKKASLYSDAVMWFWRIILVVLITVFILVITAKYLNAPVSTEQLEYEILKVKLLYSDSCIKYKNPGEIDLEKLNDAHLKKCYTKKNIGYTLNLTDMENKQIKAARSLTKEQELHIEFCLKPFKCISSSEYVLYNENNRLKPGILKIEAIKNE